MILGRCTNSVTRSVSELGEGEKAIPAPASSMSEAACNCDSIRCEGAPKESSAFASFRMNLHLLVMSWWGVNHNDARANCENEPSTFLTICDDL